jgi:amino acid transporter
VVAAVGEKSPSMFLVTFIPMLLVAFAYRELSKDTPDCGTTFTWATKAFGPWIGWIGGWGLAVSAIIVLANVSEVAAEYLYRFLGLDSGVGIGAVVDADHDPADRPRNAIDGRLRSIPKRFAYVHPRYMTPAFGTMVMGLTALFFYLALSFVSRNALADSITSLGMAVAFYYGITAYACVWYFRRSLLESARNFLMRGVFPLLGALAMTWAFGKSAIDSISPEHSETVFGPIGGVFVIGIGMLVLGIPLMMLCFAFGTKRFFRGETLTPETQVKVPDVY